MTLAQLSDAVVLLRAASSLSDFTRIRNMAVAAERYAQAEKLGTEAVGFASEIKVRAARGAGELLKRMREEGERATGHGDQKSESSRTTPVPTLDDIGVTRDQSSRWQRIAEVPVETFEAAVVEGKSETAIARMTAPKRNGKVVAPTGAVEVVTHALFETGRAIEPVTSAVLAKLRRADADDVSGIATAARNLERLFGRIADAATKGAS